MNTLEKTLVTYRNSKSRSKSQAPSSSPAEPPPHPLSFVDTWTSTDVSESTINSAWERAEALTCSSKKPSKILEMLEGWNAVSAEDPNELLTEFEADCARFVLDGIVRRASQTNTPQTVTAVLDAPIHSTPGADIPSSPSNPARANVKPTGLWQDFLHLQNNEFQHVKSKPYMLGVFIRVYLFLKYVVQSAKKPKTKAREGQGPIVDGDTANSANASFLETLERLLEASDSVRAILARDHGNVFGIWEKGPSVSEDCKTETDESGDGGEMFGWGMYVFGSYFNHDCTPTVKKRQHGRSLLFVTTRDIQEGEELCINYIDVSKGNGVVSRNAELSKEWFFECGCERCQTERG